jgi:hypothetical protein
MTGGVKLSPNTMHSETTQLVPPESNKDIREASQISMAINIRRVKTCLSKPQAEVPHNCTNIIYFDAFSYL